MRPTLRYAPIAIPAAGSDWKFTPSPTARVNVRSIIGTLTTSATVANRVPALQIVARDGQVIFDTASSSAQAASLANVWQWDAGMSGASFSGAYSWSSVVVTNAMPDLWIPPGFIVKVVTRLLDTTDAWTSLFFTYYADDDISAAQLGELEDDQ